MIILGIETSCDETAAAIVEKEQNSPSVQLLAHKISSSIAVHKKTGGIIPETAAREQIKYIIPVIDNVIKKVPQNTIDAIAVTIGPGLIGSLLIGVETAKTLAYVWNKPIIPVNHLVGHIYANWLIANSLSLIENKKPYAISDMPDAEIKFPALALVVSGGHTDLVLMKGHDNFKVLGATRDDAAGEAFDKIGRLLGLPYPAGPTIEQLAKKGNPKTFPFPRPMIDSEDFDFSFSGLKTAVLREVKTIQQLNHVTITNICASVQQAIVDVLVTKTIKAETQHKVKSILLGGASQRIPNCERNLQ